MSDKAGSSGAYPPRVRRPSGGRRWTARLALVVLAYTFAGAGEAQIRLFETLDVAAGELVQELVEDLGKRGSLAGQRVFAGAGDFFDEVSGLRLPLSDLLSGKCGALLRANGANVALSESEAVWVLHGRWRHYSKDKLRLTLFVTEPVERGEPDKAAIREALVPLGTIRPEDLRPTLDHWGPLLVRRLEREARDQRKRRVRLQPVAATGDDGAQRDVLGGFLTDWLRVAFGKTRRNLLYTLVVPPPDVDAASVETDGVLEAKAVVRAGNVVVVLHVQDHQWHTVASAQVEVPEGVFPPGVVRDPGAKRFRAKARAVTSDELDRAGATRAMRNLARARVVARALGLPPPSIDVVRSEADGVRALSGTLDHGIPADERFSGPWPDGSGGLEAELEARVVRVGDEGRPKVEASLDGNEFRAEEPIGITLSAEEAVHAAVFAWGADNQVVRLYPNAEAPDLALEAGSRVTLPRAEEGHIQSAPMPGNAEDHEAFIVLAGGGRPAFDGLAGLVGETVEETMQAGNVSGAAFFDALARLDTSRLALIVLPYRVTR